MKEEGFLQLEYEVLYDEIRSNSQICASVFTISMTVTAALIGYGLSSVEAGVFLAPFAMLIPSLYLISSQFESTIKNATYIAVIIESKADSVNWEGDWLALRQKGLNPASPSGIYTFSISSLYALASIVCLILFWVHVWPSPPPGQSAPTGWWILPFLVSLVMVLVMLFAIRHQRIVFSLEFAEQYIAGWKKLSESKADDK